VRYYYFDASVLVKAYLWEVGTEDVRGVLSSTATPEVRIVTSRLAFVEVASAVSRRRMDGELTEDEANGIWDRLQEDFGDLTAVYDLTDPDPGVVDRAAELTRHHRLRAIDALHLASGMIARRETPSGASFRFASADVRLSAAAAAEHFDVFDPRSPIPPGTSTPVAPDH
jgi:hypothetical protein